MKEQIWAEEGDLNDYLKDGWTHVFREDGTLFDRLYKINMQDNIVYGMHYFLLEKENKR